jgi:hypothetical protein
MVRIHTDNGISKISETRPGDKTDISCSNDCYGYHNRDIEMINAAGTVAKFLAM